MTQTISVSFIMEIIGTIAFAVSGTKIAIQKKLDFFGVLIIGCTTACGGGIIRDLILGINPPSMFVNPVYVLTACIVSAIEFTSVIRNKISKKINHLDETFIVMDAIGLGIFTCMGVKAGKSISPETNLFLSTFLGVITGTGGGVLRDVFVQEIPVIFRKHFYACASLCGAIICSVLWTPLGQTTATVIGTFLIIVLRLLAARYRWKLPQAK